MRVLVTGGAGFIGSSVALALAARHSDWEVVASDNLYRRGSELNLPRLKAAGVAFVHADVRRPTDLAEIGAIDALVECSAEPSVLGADEIIVGVNLTGAHHCFEYARAHGAHVIFLSTSRVYPVAPQEALVTTEAETRFELADEQAVTGASARGISEAFPLTGPRTMYGASKLAAELLLTEYELPWTINRFGVVAGPWQMGKVDQGVFTHWVLSFLQGRPLKYIGYGGAGKQVRDLLHVDDLVDLVERQLTDRPHWDRQTFNVGGGREVSLSLRETTDLCREITGNDLAVGAAGESRPGDVRIYLSDCTALFAHTDWRPQRGPRQILQDIHDWARANEALVLSALS
ncbi:MAG TPA: NAD-dependent epimerase/dehydratase family protein [Baekduia sp.]|nr:NAD-dependent epimerase/dehydratase family protein [Baekduia sp.]